MSNLKLEIIKYAKKLNDTNLSPLRSGNVSIRAKKDDVDDRINGKVTFYDDEKGFGFIKNPLNQDSYFFHFSECPDQLDVGDKVEFDLVKGEKGMNAVKIDKL